MPPDSPGPSALQRTLERTQQRTQQRAGPAAARSGAGESTPALQAARVCGALLGAGVGYTLARALPLVPSTLLSALVLAAGLHLSGGRQAAGRWWGLLGAGSGTLIGTGSVLALGLEEQAPADLLPQRLLILLLLALAGTVCGWQLSQAGRWQPQRQPRDLLRAASSLTTGVFAGIVTLTYAHSGLEAARALASRLSTSLTILVIALVTPAWLTHLLTQTQGAERHDP